MARPPQPRWPLPFSSVSVPTVPQRTDLYVLHLFSRGVGQKAVDVWKKDVWDFQAFSQTFFELRFSLGSEGEDCRNLSSQTWPGSPRRSSSRHPRPPE